MVPETLHEGAELLVESVVQDLLPDHLHILAPPREVSLHIALLAEPAGPMKRHPGHDFGVHEMQRAILHLPNAKIGMMPGLAGLLGDVPEKVRKVGLKALAEPHALIDRVERLVIDIELKLVGRGVADAHRGGAA